MLDKLKVLAFILTLFTILFAGVYMGASFEKDRYSKEKNALTDALRQYAMTAQSQREINASKDKLRNDLIIENQKRSKNEIKRITDQRDVYLERLRQSSRMSINTTSGNTAPADQSARTAASICRGDGLSKEDADFLVREAALANQFRKLLIQCTNERNIFVKTE